MQHSWEIVLRPASRDARATEAGHNSEVCIDLRQAMAEEPVQAVSQNQVEKVLLCLANLLPQPQPQERLAGIALGASVTADRCYRGAKNLLIPSVLEEPE